MLPDSKEDLSHASTFVHALNTRQKTNSSNDAILVIHLAAILDLLMIDVQFSFGALSGQNYWLKL